MSNKTGIIISEDYLRHKTQLGHPESPSRIRSIFNAIERRESGKSEKIQIIQPKPASVEDLQLVHPQSFVDEIRDFCNRGGGPIGMDTFASPETFEIAILAVGGGITAVDKVHSGEIRNAFAFIRPPGHHAGFTTAMGFCFFNNIAIVAEYLRKRRGYKRILIVDVDVHHGNGTQQIFYRSPHVMYLGFHQDGRTLYPGTGFINEVGEGDGAGFNVNVPLPPRTGDKSYLHALKTMLNSVAEVFKPEFILVSWGFDTYHDDGLAALNLTHQSYYEIAKLIRDTAEHYCSGKLAALLEGGYNTSALGDLALNAVSAFAGLSDIISERDIPEDEDITKYVNNLILNVKKEMKNYWPDF